MKEGELKKRIDKLFDEHWAEDGDWVTFSIVEPIIDEAKKELPFTKIPDFDRFINVQFTIEETRVLLQWLKKWWFGDSS